MDAEEREVYDYLKIYGEEWVNAKEVCRRAGGKRRYYQDRDWAKPVLLRMKERQIVESDIQGRWRIRPSAKNDRKGPWVAPDIKRILEEGGVQVEAQPTEESLDEHYEQL